MAALHEATRALAAAGLDHIEIIATTPADMSRIHAQTTQSTLQHQGLKEIAEMRIVPMHREAWCPNVKLNDLPRHKFFDKPKHNFKKR